MPLILKLPILAIEQAMAFEEIGEHAVRTPVWTGNETDLINLLLPAFVGFGISQVLLGLLLIARHSKKTVQQTLYALILVSLLAYFIAPFTAESFWHIGVITLMTALPGLFWLFCTSIFDDHFEFKIWQIALVASTILLPFFELLGRGLGYYIPPLLTAVLVDLPAALELLLVALALLAISRHWQVDLVQSRRDLRLWFVSINGGYLFMILMWRVVFYPYFHFFNYGQYAAAAVILLITNAMFLRVSSGILAENKTKAASTAGSLELVSETTADSAGNTLEVAESESSTAYSEHWNVALDDLSVPTEALAQLRQVMEQERIYSDMDLTIGLLAYRLELPEYKLRAVINNALGYRNFNDFLNSYRIKEVAQKLASAEYKDVTVLTLALDSGFRSLTSFNKIFKQTYNATPTSYRRQQLSAE